MVYARDSMSSRGEGAGNDVGISIQRIMVTHSPWPSRTRKLTYSAVPLQPGLVGPGTPLTYGRDSPKSIK